MPQKKILLDSNLRVLLSENERSEFLKTHKDPGMNWDNSCNTYIFQQHLAGARQEIAENIRELQEKQREQNDKETNEPGSSYEKARSRVGLALDPQIKKLEQSDQLMQDMHALSACFIGLEGLINNPPFAEDYAYTPETSFTKIKEDITNFSKEIKETIQALKDKAKEKYGNNPRIERLYNELEEKITARLTNIDSRMKAMGEKPTTEQINNLLKLKNYDGNEKSLGILASDCLMDIRDIGIKINYAISGAGENFQQGPAGIALSDIGADINEKMYTIHGAQVNNDDPTPSSQLALLTRPDVVDTAEPKYLNVSHYIPKGQRNNPKAKVKMLESMGIEVESDIQLGSDRPLTRLAAGILDIPGVIIFSSIQLLAEPIISFGESVTRLFISKPENQTKSWAQSFHEGLHAIWRSTSFLSRAKGENSSTNNSQQAAVENPLNAADITSAEESSKVKLSDIVGATPAPKNQFISTMDTFSPAAVGQFLAGDPHAKKSTQPWTTRAYNFLQSRFDYPLSTLTGDLQYFGKSSQTHAEEAESAYKERIIANHARVTSAIYQDLEKELAALSSENYTDPEYARTMRLNATPASLIQLVSVGFAKHLLETPARHNPVPATAYFLLASGSLGTLMAPTLFVPLLKVAAPLFHTLPNIASQVFTGQKATSLMPQTAACTLEFKALFFGTTLGKKAVQGKLDLSELDNPETLIAGGMALVAFGLAVSCMPLLPTDIAFGGRELFNPYAEMVDMFVNETHHLTTLYSGNPAMDATLPARALGLGFLGFKFGTLIYDSLKIPGPTQGDYDAGKSIEYNDEQQQVIQFVTEFVKEINQIANDPEQLEKMQNEGAIEKIIENTLNEKLKTSPFDESIKEKIAAQLPKLTKALGNQESREKSDALIAAANARMNRANAIVERLTNNSTNIKQKVTYQDLSDVLEEKHNIDLVGNSYFQSKSQAQQFYDHMHNTFEAYNKEHPNNSIDSKTVLEEFYRDHCYTPPNTVIRALSIIPFYPVTLVARAIGYATGKPSRREEIRKYAANDALISIQMLGAMTAFGGVAMRYISNVARPLTIATAIPRVMLERLTGTTPAYAKGATILERANDIAADGKFHKAFHWGPFDFISGKVHSVVQRISRIAQDSSEEKNHKTVATNRAIAQLNDPRFLEIKVAVDKVEQTKVIRDKHPEKSYEWIQAHIKHLEAQIEHHDKHENISHVHASAKAFFKPEGDKVSLKQQLKEAKNLQPKPQNDDTERLSPAEVNSALHL